MRSATKHVLICVAFMVLGVVTGYLASYATFEGLWHAGADVSFSFLSFVVALGFWVASRLDLAEEESYLEDHSELASGFDFRYASDAVKKAARRSA